MKSTITIATLFCMLLAPGHILAANNDITKDLSKAATTVVKALDDTAITTQVKALLALEDDIESYDIGVTTENHVVYLEGEVDTGLQADKAVEIAQGVSGVKDVDNSKWRVKSSTSYASDSFITAKVKGTIMQLSNNNTIGANSDLHVETTNGAVHIFGTVTKSNDIATIKQAVTAIKGVKSVNSNIEVKK